MSHFLDRLTFFNRVVDDFADGHGIVTREDRRWEDGYRKRWQHDKIVRSTHGANCTGSCSWKIYVKGGIVTWETQQTDYPRTRPDLPNHEPRGCSRGASYSWYLYSGNRVKYPLVRSRLLKLWREARTLRAPVAAWSSIVEDPVKRAAYTKKRGLGGFVRATWDEVTEIIAAANAYTAATYGPDRVAGFSPIPAMSMVSYAAGSRYLSLLGGVCMSFYDWYCDLPPSSPQTWGEQTDVPESADWYNSGFLILWGSNVPQTRTPDAHFYTEARYRGAKSVVICPDYSEASKFADLWISVKQGTDAALALAMGHVILREFHIDRQAKYFGDYVRQYTDMPMLVRLDRQDGKLVPGRLLRAADFAGALGESNNPDWKTVAYDEKSGELVAPHGSVGFRWGEQGKWNLEEKDSKGRDTKLRLTLADVKDEFADVAFPYFGNIGHEHFACDQSPERARTPGSGEESEARRRRGAGRHRLRSLRRQLRHRPRLRRRQRRQELRRERALYAGLGREDHRRAARADHHGRARIRAQRRKDQGSLDGDHRRGDEPLVPLRHELPRRHQHAGDVRLRRPVRRRLVALCRAGEAAPAIGLAAARVRARLEPAAAAAELDLVLVRPHRPVALRDAGRRGNRLADRAARALGRRAHRLQRARRAHGLAAIGAAARSEPAHHRQAGRGQGPGAQGLCRSGAEVRRAETILRRPRQSEKLAAQSLRLALEPARLVGQGPRIFPEAPAGHHARRDGQGSRARPAGKSRRKSPGTTRRRKESSIFWSRIDFRMSTTCVYSDIVLPTATWYEKNDLNTSDMHPFIHPLTAAVDPVWECRSDWEIYKAIAKKFSEVAPEVLGVEKDVVLTPILHDTPAEIAQAMDVKDWKRGEVEPIPGKTMPAVTVVERDYPNLYKRFTSLGPLMDKLGNGGKGMSWNTEHEVEFLKKLNGVVTEEGPSKGLAKIESDIDATEVILSLAPETNGEVAVKAWQSLGKFTGREHTHLAVSKEDEKIRFRDVVAQPRKIISSPIWSGLESEKVCYNAGYTNVHELIPWRTLTGRQQLYQDHLWMRAFGEALCVYRPPIDTKAVKPVLDRKPNGNKSVILNFITPHQKWGIHSTYTDNLLMLTLSRGGPIVWISEADAKRAGIVDNDWIEAYNTNGALVARAVVSQRVKEGMCLMYHAQEKIVNVPGSEQTGQRGGIHNSVTRTVVKPTHMIGGYAQQSYGFNYYGTIGTNRDEFVIVRKMANVDWLDKPAADQPGDPGPRPQLEAAE